MGINLGSIAIADAKLGTTQVEKIYLGSEEVWSKSTPVSIKALKFSSEGSQTLSIETTTLGTINPNFEYSLDNGATWSTWDVTTGINFGNGTDLYLRGSNTYLAKVGTNYVNFKLNTSGAFVYCSGNIMHLFDYTQDLLAFPGTADSRGVKNLFLNCTRLRSAPDFPATTLADYGYYRVFTNCANLLEPPALPATTLTQDAYQYMFAQCYALRSLPKLPAQTLSNGCYQYMFMQCNTIKMSLTQDATYTNEFILGSPVSLATVDGMFDGTAGSFAGTPYVQTLYTSNSIVRA